MMFVPHGAARRTEQVRVAGALAAEIFFDDWDLVRGHSSINSSMDLAEVFLQGREFSGPGAEGREGQSVQSLLRRVVEFVQL